MLLNFVFHHDFSFRRHLEGLRKKNIFKLPLTLTTKRYETIGNIVTSSPRAN